MRQTDARGIKVCGRLALWLTMVAAHSAIACEGVELSSLEEVYCELKASGRTAGLPGFYQFRKNPEQVQYLLLKKPARRAGIKLPDPTRRPATEQTEQSNAHATGGDALSPTLQNCQLDGSRISCSNTRYELQDNSPRHALAAQALESELRLPARAAMPGLSDQQYLSRLYPIYVEKMLDIGLPGAVMSYTRFVANYREVTQKGGDFTARMGRMYQLLIEERRSRPVKARYNEKLPENIGQCMNLTEKLVVCDDIQTTWVFTRLPPG